MIKYRDRSFPLLTLPRIKRKFPLHSCRLREVLTDTGRPDFLPTLFRWAASLSPGAIPFSTFSPFPPWSLGCDPRRSRGKAWLPVLDATCNCLPLSCSPQLPYTAYCSAAPRSLSASKWALRLWERHTRRAQTVPETERQLEEKENEESTAWVGQLGWWCTRFFSLFPSLLKEKKNMYSPNDARNRRGNGGEGEREGGYSVKTRQKIMTQSFWCLFLVISLQSVVPCCLEVRLGLPGF